jgi:hypothetical protein
MALKIPYLYIYIKIMRDAGRSNPKSQIYVVLDKEKPCIGSVRSLNFAVVTPTTIQLIGFPNYGSTCIRKIKIS